MRVSPRPLFAPAWFTAAVLLASASPGGAQGGCQFGAGTGDFRSVEIPGAGRVTYVGRPHFVCADGVHIWADSAVAYSAQNMSHLLGSVRYRDRTRELRADEARYFSQAARIQASGRVLLRDTAQGSEIEHGDLVYLRRASFRDREQITVTVGSDGVRPRAKLYMKTASVPQAPRAPAFDTAPAPPRAGADTARAPYLVVSDRIFLQADEYFLASGSVEIERDSLRAHADTAEYDQVAARMLLKGSARVAAGTYTLWGSTINLAMPEGEVSNIRAVRRGVLVGKDLRLEAPFLQLFLSNGALERLVATPLPRDPSSPPVTTEDSSYLARPVAEAEAFRLSADSLDVLAPGEVLDRIVATGSARGVSWARDSLNVPSLPEVARTDWIEGDTIMATFSRVDPYPGVPADTASREYRLEELVARGSAKSLYRLLPNDTAWRAGVDAPGVHYVTGTAIRIAMREGEVDRMEVEGPTRGWHLEPMRSRAGSDTLARPAVVPPPDTGAVGPSLRVSAGAWAPGSSPGEVPATAPEGQGGPALSARAARESHQRRKRERG